MSRILQLTQEEELIFKKLLEEEFQTLYSNPFRKEPDNTYSMLVGESEDGEELRVACDLETVRKVDSLFRNIVKDIEEMLAVDNKLVN